MRRWIPAASAMLLVLSMAACSLPQSLAGLDPEDENASEAFTYVITTECHTGLDRMADCITWRNNAVCGMMYIGTRSDYTKTLRALYTSRFADVDEDRFNTMQKVDAGGDEVYLVVPRFTRGQISVFSVGIDNEGQSHTLKQLADVKEPFLLFCNPDGTRNVQLSTSLKNIKQSFKYIPSRSSAANNALLKPPISFQDIS